MSSVYARIVVEITMDEDLTEAQEESLGKAIEEAMAVAETYIAEKTAITVDIYEEG
jgi:hypothetical protein